MNTLTIIPLSTLLLLLLTPTPATSHLDSTVDYNVAAAASYHCDGTLYPDLCASTLTSIPNLTTKKLPEIISHACNQTVTAVESSASNCSSIYRHLLKKLEPRQRMALTDCLDLMDETVDELRRAVVDLSMSNSTPTYARLCEIRSVLSASITNQYTCLDGFAYNKGSDSVRPMIEKPLYHISHMVSNSLAMAKKFHPKGPKDEPLDGYGEVKGEFPEWLTRKDRRLLQTAAAPTANLTVAKDGSGNFTTIGAALAVTPNNSATRFVIYIKAGAYLENVEVGKKQINVMFVGDGIGKTVIKASRNVVDGWTTFRSATVAVVGTNFLGRDLTIENSAGPSKHQAVALRVGADLSAFYRCSFVGYQDTLYVHTLRQFFRECDIYGTVDFIFGNSAVVFQNCSLYARKPDPNQKNIFTAQGREDPNQNTGISIQSCKVAAAADLLPVQSTFQSYLGRPWKQYSRTVFMQSELDSLIDPAGWLEWNGTFALDTLYYGEYHNFGNGSSTANRVNWPGYRVINSSAEASQFTVASFIQGTEWLPATIPFTSGLS